MAQHVVAEKRTRARGPHGRSCRGPMWKARHEGRSPGDETKESDRKLAQAVNAALGQSNDGRLRSVFCNVHDSHVRLKGHVPSYYAKQLALHAVMSVNGVSRIDDDLIVE